jgi:hypothetical protein
MLYLNGERLRLDMNAPSGTLSNLVDQTGTYTFDNDRRTAWRSSAGGEFPVLSLDCAARSWSSMARQLDASAGVKRTQLGRKRVHGQSCRGVRYSGKLSAVAGADELYIAEGLPPLGTYGVNWQGTFWIKESLSLPMRMTSSFAGVTVEWDVSDLASWDIPELMLKVPPGYAIRDRP